MTDVNDDSVTPMACPPTSQLSGGSSSGTGGASDATGSPYTDELLAFIIGEESAIGGTGDGDNAGPGGPSSIVSASGGRSPAATMGHSFIKKNFHKPAYCHFCLEMLWGILGTTGYCCEVCNLLVHEKCMKSVLSPCSTISSLLIDEPASHCWSETGHFKRKFCNVCRKRLEDSPAVQCTVCEYYVHLECQEFVCSNCKNVCHHTPEKHDDYSPQYFHHWREGNLPSNSKCALCKKSCWSSECLGGFRCEWCYMTAHAGCYRSLSPECNFGPLREIMLPPAACCLPRTNIPMGEIIANSPMRNAIEEWSSSGDSKEDSSVYERRSVRDKMEGEEGVVRVFDGNNGYRKRQCRYVAFSKSMTGITVLEQALKALHILPLTRSFCICEINERDGSEHRIEENNNFRSQLKFDVRRPAVVVRLREMDVTRGVIRVYPGTLLQEVDTITTKMKYIQMTTETSAKEALLEAMRKFGSEHIDASKFCLVDTCLNGPTPRERQLNEDDRPLRMYRRLGQDSVRAAYLTRYYVRPAEDPFGSGVALFVGNLKPGLSQRVYEKILLEKLGTENKWDSIDVIYYEYGSLVLLYATSEKAEAAYSVLKEDTFDEKPLLVLILPRLIPSLIPENVHPLLVFVNVKSGGCQGLELITNFRKLLNPHQVFNLDFGGPLPGLYCFRMVLSYKILVCGGDGTVGWALSCLDNVSQDAKCTYPPMAIVPLGTGNDLARVLRWGTGYSSGVDTLSILRDVVEAEEIKLDRWTVIFHPEEKDKDATKMALQYDTNAANTNEDNASIFVMNNYFGVGIDADVQLDFHAAREENLSKSKFNSRIFNKSIYFTKGIRKMVNRSSCKDLHKQIVLEVDGKVIDLPPLEGVIILNILSWGAGAKPWGSEREESFNKPTHYDGMLEVFGVSGVVHMGQIYSGLRTGIRVAQGGHIKITLKNDIPVQVDGEPWIQSAGHVAVLRSALRATMLKKRKTKFKRRNTDPSVPSTSYGSGGGSGGGGGGGGQSSGPGSGPNADADPAAGGSSTPSGRPHPKLASSPPSGSRRADEAPGVNDEALLGATSWPQQPSSAGD